ncbi:MAG: DUF1579 family protein [Phycisphaerae bacterium]
MKGMARFVNCGGLLTLVLAVGCGAPKGGMAMEDMQPPPRPAEMDQLAAWVGNWTYTVEMSAPGTPEPMTGSSRITWEYGKRFLIEHMEGQMGEEETFRGMAIYTWDANAGKYRTWMFDNMGGVDTGTMSYDESTNTWHMSGKGYNPANGERTYGEGSIKMEDDNTMEWQWTEWDSPWKLQELMSFKGTSRRS